MIAYQNIHNELAENVSTFLEDVTALIISNTQILNAAADKLLRATASLAEQNLSSAISTGLGLGHGVNAATMERTLTLINDMTQNLKNLSAIADNLSRASAWLAEINVPSISTTNDLNGQQRWGVKRSSDETPADKSPNKMSKISKDHNGTVDGATSGDINGGTDDDTKVVVGNKCGSLMNINANMDRCKTIENLNEWLARVYNETAKFYSIKKYSHIGTFILYIAIDITLDESKDDIHVVINSDHLQRRDDIIYKFIQDCFQERKVVTLLHIVTHNATKLRENEGQLEEIIKAMMKPIVAHL